MLISRRMFIVATGLVPAARLLPGMGTDSTFAEPVPPPALPEGAAPRADASGVALKIDGWSVRDVGDEAWFTINRSWRTSWR